MMKEKVGNQKNEPKNGARKVRRSKPSTKKKKSDFDVWRFENPIPAISAGKYLQIETRVSAIIHWSANGWQTSNDTPTHKNRRKMHIAELKPDTDSPTAILFTFYWTDAGRWENRDFQVCIMD